MSEFNNLKLEIADQTAVLSISRPAALNALNSETLDELNTALTEIEAMDDVKVVILTGGPDKKGNEFKSFVAGADISEMVNFTAPEARAFGIKASVPFFKLMNMRQVTIAAVNGFALGGGCEIAMACDIRIASDNAVFGQPECGLGIIPGFGGTQRLARLVGMGRAKEMIFTCDNIDANEAYRIGLVNKVVAKEELMATAKAMAAKIISKGSYAVSVAKAATVVLTSLVLWLTLNDFYGACFKQQFNIAVAALVVGALAMIEKRREGWAALFIVIGTFVKIYGIVGLAFFFFVRRKGRFIGYMALWSAMALLLPLLFVSPEYLWSQYAAWAADIVQKNGENMFCAYTNISLVGCVRKISGSPAYSDLLIIVPAMVLFLLSYLRTGQYKHFSYRLTMLASLLLFIVLFSSGSEHSGYVIAALGMGIWWVNFPPPRTRPARMDAAPTGPVRQFLL